MELVNEYIEGRMELLDILKIIIEESVQNDWSLYIWKWNFKK
jgi:hypothetical protein